MRTALADELRERGRIDPSECFVDATFAPAKKSVRSGLVRRYKNAFGKVFTAGDYPFSEDFEVEAQTGC
jgi:hypothetical protein